MKYTEQFGDIDFDLQKASTSFV